MSLPIRAALVPMLQAAFSKEKMEVGGPLDHIAVFRAKHPAVGDLVIHDEGDEVTVLLNVTHWHIGSQDWEATPEAQAQDIASRVVESLRQLFSDEVEFFGSVLGGGARERNSKRRGFLSKLLLGRSYVWSGPLAE